MTLPLWGSLVALATFCVAGVVAAYSWRKLHEFSLAVMVWVLLAWLLAQNGFFAKPDQFFPQDIAGLTAFAISAALPLLLLLAAWRFVKPFRAFIATVPLRLLVGVQVYRAVGVIFLWATREGLLPLAFGLLMGIGDLLIGALALPLAWWVRRNNVKAYGAVAVWNLFGIADLFVGVSLFVLAFFNVLPMQPAPAILGLYPLALLALFQMPLSLVLHLLVLHRLRTQ